MTNNIFRNFSLVVYRQYPAIVLESGEKLLLELQSGSRVKVRHKDVSLIHPGPLETFAELGKLEGDPETAWRIFQELGEPPGTSHSLAELSELIFGKFTPSTAWNTWLIVMDGLYFRGLPQEIIALTPDESAAVIKSRQIHAAETAAWDDFLKRLSDGLPLQGDDRRFLRDVEDLAFGRSTESKVLRALGRSQRPELAHRLLLELGVWDEFVNPHPTRLEMPSEPPSIELPDLVEEPRRDLTGMQAYAIDDEDNQDPDDALSLEFFVVDPAGVIRTRLWVHVADPASLAPPGSPVDLDARSRGATLYLPEKIVPMLPERAIEILGLGLNRVSPALSFGLTVGSSGEIEDVEIVLSIISAERLTYRQADERLDEPHLDALNRLAGIFRKKRIGAGAMELNLPEVRLRLEDKKVELYELTPYRSREIVREAMMAAGEAVARFAFEHRIPFPYLTQEWGQDLPVGFRIPETIAQNFNMRRMLKRSQVSSYPAPHSALGLSIYSRCTSPLRRYLDLVVHQQLRAFLMGQELIGQTQMLERVGAAESVTSSVNLAEWQSRRHWTLVYLSQHPGWRGAGVVLENHGGRTRVLIPELGFETSLFLKYDLTPDSEIELELQNINLPDLEANFVVL